MKRRPLPVPTLTLEYLECRTVPSFTSTVSGSTATMTGTSTGSSGDTLVFVQTSGFLAHNRAGVDAGFFSPFDFDVTKFGDQKISAAAGSTVNVTLGKGPDVINIGGTISSVSSAASDLKATFALTNSNPNGQSLSVDDSTNK